MGKLNLQRENMICSFIFGISTVVEQKLSDTFILSFSSPFFFFFVRDAIVFLEFFFCAPPPNPLYSSFLPGPKDYPTFLRLLVVIALPQFSRAAYKRPLVGS